MQPLKTLMLVIVAILGCISFLSARSFAQESIKVPESPTELDNAESQQKSENKYAHIKIETVVEGLNNPCGIAIQPETGQVYIADSGALRIVRVTEGAVEEVITGFTKDVYGEDPKYDIGPLGICFLNANTLVVGGGGKPDGEDLMRVYQIPGGEEKAITADKTLGDGATLPKSDEAPGEGNFYGLVKASRGVFVTCNGDDDKGWISLVTFTDEKEIKELSRAVATKELTEVDAPVAITLSPDRYLTVGQMGEIAEKADSLLCFYSEEGDFLGKFETGLFDITALAFGPNRGRLYATDFRWSDTDEGGLYKLIGLGEDRKQGCRAELVTRLKKPTAMTFSESGELYVLLAGDQGEEPNGKLIKISGLDDPGSYSN